MTRALVAVMLLAAAPACTARDCTADARLNMRITVQGADGSPICDALVSIVEPDAVTQPPPSNDCTYPGLYERTGTFDVRAVHDGVEQRREVKVSSDGCHPKLVDVVLTFPPPTTG